MKNDPTAGLVVIGDEVLSAQIQEKNAALALPKLRAAGMFVKRCSIITDSPDDIQETIKSFSARFTWVITSGGVGPTHDDRTMESIAKAFDTDLHRPQELLEILKQYVKPPLHEGFLRLADVPKGSELIYSEHHKSPLVLFKNIFICPGIPDLFEAKLKTILDKIGSTPFIESSIYLSLEEPHLATELRAFALKHQDVQIGSYPKLTGDWKTRLTVKSKNKDRVQEVSSELSAMFSDHLVSKEIVS